MKDEERVIYRLVKEAKNNGIWLKQLKDRSGLHTQLANTVIKNLEKKNIIKWVKPVKVRTYTPACALGQAPRLTPLPWPPLDAAQEGLHAVRAGALDGAHRRRLVHRQ